MSDSDADDIITSLEGDYDDMTQCVACTGIAGDGAVTFCARCCAGEIPHIHCASCEDCGRKYGDDSGFPDLIIPDYVWARISPYHDERGLLCPSCIVRRAANEGFENVPAFFMSGPFCIPAYDDEAQRILREWEP